MNPNTGEVYTEEQYQAMAEEKQRQLVLIQGTPGQVALVSSAVKAAAKKRRKQQKASRKSNR